MLLRSLSLEWRFAHSSAETVVIAAFPWPLLRLHQAIVSSDAVRDHALNGGWVEEANGPYSGEFGELFETHEDRADILRWVASGFGVVALAAALWHTRTGALRAVLSGLVLVGAVATGIYVVLTGDAGAQVAWYGVKG